MSGFVPIPVLTGINRPVNLKLRIHRIDIRGVYEV